jgi:hypothetical protein
MRQRTWQYYDYSDHNMTDRLAKIHAKRKTLSATKLRRLMEKWDVDQGNACHATRRKATITPAETVAMVTSIKKRWPDIPLLETLPKRSHNRDT